MFTINDDVFSEEDYNSFENIKKSKILKMKPIQELFFLEKNFGEEVVELFDYEIYFFDEFVHHIKKDNEIVHSYPRSFWYRDLIASYNVICKDEILKAFDESLLY